jgi:hypothetical protein
MGDHAYKDGQFDDAEDDHVARDPLHDAGGLDVTWSGASEGPANCANRTRAQDAEAVALDLRARMEAMDPRRLAELVRARNSAAGIADVFPDGDQRFASVEPDEDELGTDGDGGYEEDSDSDQNAIETDQDGIPLSRNARHETAEEDPCIGLLDEHVDAGPQAALVRAKDRYGVDLIAAMDDAKLDFFARIRLVNYIRSRVRAGDSPEQAASAADAAILAGPTVGILADDAYLKPVVPGDVLLTILDTDEDNDIDDVARAVERTLGQNGTADQLR